MPAENFEIGPIRPPDEADSLLIRTTRGCPWNRCTFCTLYKGMDFSMRSVEEIKQDIEAAKEFYKGSPVANCFLQDGDSFVMKTADLIEVLKTLKTTFPSLKQISSYGRAQTMSKKSAEELKEIADAGLNMLYCGMESGSDEVLKKVKKGVTAQRILDSTISARQAGMGILLFTILGLGGKELTQSHAEGTARLINAINPEDIRILSLSVKPDTALDTMRRDGDFTMLTEVEMIEEQQRILKRLDGVQSKYGNYHGVNLLNELQGELPKDKEMLLSIIDTFLSLEQEDQLNFIYGKRNRYYGRLSDLKRGDRYTFIQEAMRAYSSEQLEELFHTTRKQWI